MHADYDNSALFSFLFVIRRCKKEYENWSNANPGSVANRLILALIQTNIVYIIVKVEISRAIKTAIPCRF